MRVLITGFEPFGGEIVNPALEAVMKIDNKLNHIDVIKAKLPVVFHQSISILRQLIELHKPTVVICVGQAGGRTSITLERVGINVDDARIPDNEGNTPVDQKINPNGPDAYFSSLPIKAIVSAINESGIPANISNSAGTYVCNHVLYGLCDLIASSSLDIKGGFMHVPFAPEQVVKNPGQPSMSVENIVSAIETAIRISCTVTNDIAVADGSTH
ncbi:MAG: pyroglutamyl-peptidase I [Clostridiales bacterium]|nr:pyroglutamyl-peptidase I [Clostridiales bacterium]MDW7662507.1 pyroglutamyl-peptidase I [Bacillota bacterium]